MHKRTRLAIVIGVLSLGACDSFTLSYTHGDRPDPSPQAPAPTNPASGVVQTDPVQTQSSVIKSLTDIQQKQQGVQNQVMQSWCPKWNPPRLPAVPAAPAAALAQLKPNETDAIAALTRQHIVELHAWASRAQAIYAQSYREYLTNCAKAKQQVAIDAPNM
jgi:hypothetical protein